MNKTFRIASIIVMLAIFSFACALLGSSTKSEPKTPIAPIIISDDLSLIDLCQAIPQEDIEAVMGRKLTSPPQAFNYYDAPNTSGCSYDAGKDSSGEAHFGYVVLTPIEVYGDQPFYQNIDVSGIGDQAYFNNGADARQLWVKLDNKVAFVVAFGDVPNEEGAKAMAKLLVSAIK